MSERRKRRPAAQPSEVVRKKAKCGILEEDKKKNADQYRRVGAVSMSLVLNVLSLCMGETVADVDRGFDAKAAETEEIRDLLASIASKSRKDK